MGSFWQTIRDMPPIQRIRGSSAETQITMILLTIAIMWLLVVASIAFHNTYFPDVNQSDNNSVAGTENIHPYIGISKPADMDTFLPTNITEASDYEENHRHY